MGKEKRIIYTNSGLGSKVVDRLANGLRKEMTGHIQIESIQMYTLIEIILLFV